MAHLALWRCDFNRERAELSVYSEIFSGRFPPEIDVHSHHTDRVVRFRPVQPGHRLFNEDFWDGEQMVYAPCEPVKNVESLVVYHAC